MSTSIPDKILPGESAQAVCVLSGSMGSPASLCRFFQSLGDFRSIAFVITMPISPAALPLLCNFFARNTEMRVLPALSGHLLSHGEIVVVPTDRLLMMDDIGQMNLVPPVNLLLNPIDMVMQALAHHFRNNCRAIIFSGIGEDGQQGCRTIAEYGGEIWTQSEQSSHFDSMSNYVREVCEVKFSSTPEKLALRLRRELSGEQRKRRLEARVIAG